MEIIYTDVNKICLGGTFGEEVQEKWYYQKMQQTLVWGMGITLLSSTKTDRKGIFHFFHESGAETVIWFITRF